MPEWTTPAAAERRLRRRWDSGDLLRSWAAGEPWEPVSVGLRGPTARELVQDLTAAQKWAAAWGRHPGYRLEHRRVGGRLVGVNEIPARAWVDSYELMWRVLGVADQVTRFDRLMEDVRRRAPRLVDWAMAKPLTLLALAPTWDAVLATVLWIDAHDERIYLRQVDVPGVDTKFIERHRAVLADLLDHQLPPERIDPSRQQSDFEARYRFRRRPVYVRLRTLDADRPLPGGYAELTVPRDELLRLVPDHPRVFVIENEITYLAFPPVPDALAVLGGGYAITNLNEVAWLADRELTYWGDIDTHGLAILDRLRERFGHTRSMLMDHSTLHAHKTQWVTEPRPTNAPLHHLTPAEAGLYEDLVDDTFGPAVRLEQERISYSAIERALGGWRGPCPGSGVRVEV